MNVLIGCEYSGVVREAFAARGHNAWSCDLLPSDTPTDKHYQGDIFDFIEGDWDLAIFHPPCTDLAISGAAHFPAKIKDGRQARAIESYKVVHNGKKQELFKVKEKITTPDGRRVVVCPAQTCAPTKCETCKLCSKADRNYVIAFVAHGNGKKKVNTFLNN